MSLLLASIIVSALTSSVTAANVTIHIRADGSIEPLAAPISIIDGYIYRFTEDIEGSVIVECNNIVIDGMGYTIFADQSKAGISLTGTNNVTVKCIRIEGGSQGIQLIDASNNIFYGNHVTINNVGVSLSNSSNNQIYHNNFVENTIQVDSDLSSNIWDMGYPPGGNYWSDNDEQNHLMDGIGTSSYTINEKNIDAYPFIYPYIIAYSGLWEETEYTIDIVSNSSISDFYFNPSQGPVVSFCVSGEIGTQGFCKISFPHQLISVENHNWTVLIDDQPSNNYEIYNDVLSFIEHIIFTYEHNTKTFEIQGTQIIPEFSTWVTLSIFCVLSLALFLIFKRNQLIKAVN